MENHHVIGVDLGGTNLKIGVVSHDGKLLSGKTVTLTDLNPQAVISLIAQEIQHIRSDKQWSVKGIGCGIAGIIDHQAGVVLQSPNLPSWNDLPFLSLLKEKVGDLPIMIDNDANCAAVAEHMIGAAQKEKSFILLTLGTGIGGGVFLEGKLWRGDKGFAGEVGHMVVESNGSLCACGAEGCWEQYAGSRAFTTLIGKLPAAERQALLSWGGGGAWLTPEAMASLASKGDAFALKLWKEFGRYLGVGIHSLINVFGVTTFVIGGGIASSWDFFIDATEAEIKRRAYRWNGEHLSLCRATLGSETGVVGAGLLASQASL